MPNHRFATLNFEPISRRLQMRAAGLALRLLAKAQQDIEPSERRSNLTAANTRYRTLPTNTMTRSSDPQRIATDGTLLYSAA